jgi:hypothetical protein
VTRDVTDAAPLGVYELEPKDFARLLVTRALSGPSTLAGFSWANYKRRDEAAAALLGIIKALLAEIGSASGQPAAQVWRAFKLNEQTRGDHG